VDLGALTLLPDLNEATPEIADALTADVKGAAGVN
jgi:hypothetical protein